VSGMRKWRTHCQEIKHIYGASSKITRRSRCITLAKCFGLWHEHAVEEKRTRHIMDARTQKALAIWRIKSLVVGFGGWHEHAAEETRQRNIMERILIRMTIRRLSGAMWRWCENLQERVRIGAKTRKAWLFGDIRH
jgi:hypothetical protein